MRLIHCADIHLDSKMSSNLTKEKARERKAELLNTFGEMVRYGEKNLVAGIIIAGDLFDTKNITAAGRNTDFLKIYDETKLMVDYAAFALDESLKDLIGICMRMALVDAMYQADKPFVIFDDPFANLDGGKLEGALHFLEEIGGDYQVLYFTCHESRAAGKRI